MKGVVTRDRRTTFLDMDVDPLLRFSQAYERARGSEPFDVARAALATADSSGRPSVRFVLVKEFDARGFAVYTNYESDKARDLAANPYGALAWHWHTTGEQIRVSGPMAPAPAERSDAYFRDRPRESQIGAWASAQSRALVSREALVDSVQEAEARFRGGAVPRPSHWGGYLLAPDRFEFWQNQDHRLHDRWVYVREGDGWGITRLAP